MLQKLRTLSARNNPRIALRNYLLLTIGALMPVFNVNFFLEPTISQHLIMGKSGRNGHQHR